MHAVARALALPLVLSACIALGACATNVQADGGASSGVGASGGGGGARGEGGSTEQGGSAACFAQPECALDPPGSTFTFHVHNATGERRWLTFGCNYALPITLTTPSGELRISPSDPETCGVPCEAVYCTEHGFLCSECTPPSGIDTLIEPGATSQVAWDRRVYVQTIAPAECTFSSETSGCRLGIRVGPSTSQMGTLTICTDATSLGRCVEGANRTVPFTVDTTADSATIVLR